MGNLAWSDICCHELCHPLWARPVQARNHCPSGVAHSLPLCVSCVIRRQFFKITNTSCSRINFNMVLCLEGTVFSNDRFLHMFCFSSPSIFRKHFAGSERFGAFLVGRLLFCKSRIRLRCAGGLPREADASLKAAAGRNDGRFLQRLTS